MNATDKAILDSFENGQTTQDFWELKDKLDWSLSKFNHALERLMLDKKINLKTNQTRTTIILL